MRKNIQKLLASPPEPDIPRLDGEIEARGVHCAMKRESFLKELGCDAARIAIRDLNDLNNVGNVALPSTPKKNHKLQFSFNTKMDYSSKIINFLRKNSGSSFSTQDLSDHLVIKHLWSHVATQFRWSLLELLMAGEIHCIHDKEAIATPATFFQRFDYSVRWSLFPDPLNPRIEGCPPIIPPQSSPKERTAITLSQPWIWAILNLGKDIENRTWPTDYRGELYLHAGQTYDQDGHEWLEAAMGATVPEKLPKGGILGVVELVDCQRDIDSDWAIPGQWNWKIKNARSIPFEPMLGRMRLWVV